MTPHDAPDWRDLSREALDAGFNNVNAVADSAELLAGWEPRAAAMRAAHPDHLDIGYGPRPRNRFDLFKAGDGAPTLIFIHGGYWQTRAKENFSHFAAGPLAHGISVAMIGYTLAPDATLDEIVAEVHTAIDAVAAHGATAGGAIVLSGWSAGGHLTAMGLAHPKVAAGLAISGLFDLEPIRHCYLNDKLRLDEAMAQRNSPMMLKGGAMKPLSLVCGDDELALLRQQSADFAGRRAALGLPVAYEEIPGANHFSIMAEMETPDGRIVQLIRGLLERVG